MQKFHLRAEMKMSQEGGEIQKLEYTDTTTGVMMGHVKRHLNMECPKTDVSLSLNYILLKYHSIQPLSRRAMSLATWGLADISKVLNETQSMDKILCV